MPMHQAIGQDIEQLESKYIQGTFKQVGYFNFYKEKGKRFTYFEPSSDSIRNGYFLGDKLYLKHATCRSLPDLFEYIEGEKTILRVFEYKNSFCKIRVSSGNNCNLLAWKKCDKLSKYPESYVGKLVEFKVPLSKMYLNPSTKLKLSTKYPDLRVTDYRFSLTSTKLIKNELWLHLKLEKEESCGLIYPYAGDLYIWIKAHDKNGRETILPSVSC